ncbi:MAG: hypothetical protein DWI19_00570 [Planctomycetota bacterium]|nr:MAG: hypothetical protein DWI19_00570 [Planctomycetota bacterium]
MGASLDRAALAPVTAAAPGVRAVARVAFCAATASSSIPVRAMRVNRDSGAGPAVRVMSMTSPLDCRATSAAGVPSRQNRHAHGVPATGCRKYVENVARQRAHSGNSRIASSTSGSGSMAAP